MIKIRYRCTYSGVMLLTIEYLLLLAGYSAATGLVIDREICVTKIVSIRPDNYLHSLRYMERCVEFGEERYYWTIHTINVRVA